MASGGGHIVFCQRVVLEFRRLNNGMNPTAHQVRSKATQELPMLDFVLKFSNELMREVNTYGLRSQLLISFEIDSSAVQQPEQGFL